MTNTTSAVGWLKQKLLSLTARTFCCTSLNGWLLFCTFFGQSSCLAFLLFMPFMERNTSIPNLYQLLLQ